MVSRGRTRGDTGTRSVFLRPHTCPSLDSPSGSVIAVFSSSASPRTGTTAHPGRKPGSVPPVGGRGGSGTGCEGRIPSTHGSVAHPAHPGLTGTPCLRCQAGAAPGGPVCRPRHTGVSSSRGAPSEGGRGFEWLWHQNPVGQTAPSLPGGASLRWGKPVRENPPSWVIGWGRGRRPRSGGERTLLGIKPSIVHVNVDRTNI